MVKAWKKGNDWWNLKCLYLGLLHLLPVIFAGWGLKISKDEIKKVFTANRA